MRKFLPVILAVLAFFVILLMIQPPAQVQVPVAAADLPAGHVIAAGDLTTVSMPSSAIPADAVRKPEEAVGQALTADRAKGDWILKSQLGAEPVTLRPDERAVSVVVDDASGLAGVLKPGDRVGVTAVMDSQSGTYSKVTVENLRLLYVDPQFRAQAEDQSVVVTPEPMTGAAVPRQRQASGAVILAVPTTLQAVVYDLAQLGDGEQSQTRKVNAIELLAALSGNQATRLSLYLMPDQAQAFTSPGLYLPELVITPVTPTPTPEAGK